jgi:hypothetical protein
VRWHILVAALGLENRLLQTVRLGALGFVLNFVSLGGLGGDLFKAIFLAKDYPGRRTEAVATVVADRLLGMLMMFALATTATLLVDWSGAPTAVIVLIHMIRLVGVASFVAAGLLLAVPALSGERLQSWVGKLPLVGSTVARLIGAVSAYRNQKRQLLLAAGLCLVVDSLFILSFYLVARGLPVQAPTLAQHFVIIPAATLAGAIPATPSGLGAMEAAVNALYQAVPSPATIPPGDGTLVALGQRATMILVAVVCLVFYLSRRTDLRNVMHEVEEAIEEAEPI